MAAKKSGKKAAKGTKDAGAKDTGAKDTGAKEAGAEAVAAAPTELPPAGDAETVYIVDISGYIFRAYFALPPMSSSRGEPTHAVLGVTKMLLKLIDERDPKLLAVALDAKGGSFRKDIYGKYKANRPEPPPDLSQQIERVHEVLGALRVPMLEQAGMEADDVIATCVKQAREKGWKAVIVSADKDLLQLVGDGVVMYDTMRDRVFGVPETFDKFGVPPHQVRDLLALMGDSSDNVPGVPGVGVQTAAKLLGQFPDLDMLYESLDEVKGAARKKLAANEEQAMLSRELVTLRDDVDVELDEDAVRWPGADEAKVQQLFTELEFTQLLSRLDTTAQVEGQVEVVDSIAALEEAAAAIREAGALSLATVLSGDDPLVDDLVGVGLSWMEGRALYLPIAHRYIGAPEPLPQDEVLAILKPLLENSLLPKLAEDVKAQDLIWSRLGVTFRGASFDLQLADYLYDPGRHSHALEAVARAELDVEVPKLRPLTHPKKGKKRAPDEVEVGEMAEVIGAHADYVLRLSRYIEPRMDFGDFKRLFHALELPLAHVLADMERLGVRIDAALLEKMSEAAGAEMEALEKKAQELAGHEFNVGSPRQLETILFDELELPVIKRTKTARSTDASVLEELAEKHELPKVIIEHRTVSKLKSTYLDALPAAVNPETGRVHTRYNQAVAATGRLSSSNPNLQNIPIRTEMGRKIRDAFVPAEGHLLLAADYSQIELRVLAHLSQDPELLDAYGKGEDVHVRTATALFECDAADVTREQRGQAKTVNFAVIYGQTQWALAKNLGTSKTEARRYIDAFFARYAGVQRYMDELVEEARSTGYVATLLGRRRAVNDIRSRNPSLRHAAERVARNTPIQGTAADIIKLAMVQLHRRLRKAELGARMILTVHDELVFEVPEGEREAVEPLVRETMEGVMELAVPLVVDVGWGADWGAAH